MAFFVRIVNPGKNSKSIISSTRRHTLGTSSVKISSLFAGDATFPERG